MCSIRDARLLRVIIRKLHFCFENTERNNLYSIRNENRRNEYFFVSSEQDEMASFELVSEMKLNGRNLCTSRRETKIVLRIFSRHETKEIFETFGRFEQL